MPAVPAILSRLLGMPVKRHDFWRPLKTTKTGSRAGWRKNQEKNQENDPVRIFACLLSTVHDARAR